MMPPTSRCVRIVGAVMTAVLLLASLWSSGVGAELDPVAQQQIEPSVVELALWLVGAKDGQPIEETRPRGSGAVVSSDGLILTNAHVITTQGLAEEVAAEAAQAAQQGSELTLAPAADLDGTPYFRVLIPDQSGNPVPEYTAQVVGVDLILDLAVLRVVGDAYGVPLGDHPLPFTGIPLGDSDVVQRAQPVHIFGYPAGLGLLYTEGAISGYAPEPGVVGRAWIYTNAKVAAGNSGGAAVDDAGRLIGIPTAVLPPECRPDATDEGNACQPTGDSFAQLRPINLAKPLLRKIAPDLVPPASAPATSTAAPTASSAAASPPTAADAAATPFVAGDTAITLAGAVIRSAADPNAEVVAELAAGAPVILVSPQLATDGSTWWMVQNLSNLTASGYIEASFLTAHASVPVIATPGASPGPAGDDFAAATPAAAVRCGVPHMADRFDIEVPLATLNSTVTVQPYAQMELTLPAGTEIVFGFTYGRIFGSMMWMARDLSLENEFWIADQYLDYQVFNPATPECNTGALAIVDHSAPMATQAGETAQIPFADRYPAGQDLVVFIDGPPEEVAGATWWPVHDLYNDHYFVQQDLLKPAVFTDEAPPPPSVVSPTDDSLSVLTWPSSATVNADVTLYGVQSFDDPDHELVPIGSLSAGTPLVMYHYLTHKGDIFWYVYIRGTTTSGWVRDSDLAYHQFDPLTPEANLGAFAMVNAAVPTREFPESTARPFDLGPLLVINGPPIPAENDTWWPVIGVNGGTVTAYIQGQFLSPIVASPEATPEPSTPEPSTPPSG